MSKMILWFAVLFAIAFLGIQGAAKMSGKEKASLLKTVVYSLICAGLATGIAAGIVLIF